MQSRERSGMYWFISPYYYTHHSCRSDLSPKERIAYIDAVLCFQAKPPITPSSFAPGARSRYDDFIVTHINQTFSIHGTVSSHWTLGITSLLTSCPQLGQFSIMASLFHTCIWQSAPKGMRVQGLPAILELGSLCCVRNTHDPTSNKLTSPWSDPIHSPLFDGSATSLGGNGEYVKYNGTLIPGAPPGLNDVIPPAGGGGCVTKGPFKKYVNPLWSEAIKVHWLTAWLLQHESQPWTICC